jgi:hypothetical protein
MQVQVKIPGRIAEFVESSPNGFKHIDDATAADWRTAVRLAKQNRELAPIGARGLLRAAKLCGIPDDVPLLPRLRMLASDNIVALPPPSKSPR